MRIRQLGFATLAGIGLAAGGPARAELKTYQFDPVHTNVIFLVDHLGFSRMVGQFETFDGSLQLDPEALGQGAVSITIRTDSVDTDYEKRDAHLRSPDFFNAAEFPTLTFESTKVEPTGEKTARVQGNLTMLGVTKPVTLEMTLNRVGPHPSPQMAGVTVAGFSGRTQLHRSDFGMTGMIPNIGDEVEIWLEVEAHHKP
jgi:polyisoprenoid-binding protein YceI